MSAWKEASNPPKFADKKEWWCTWPMSSPVLVCDEDGNMGVATFEQIDEDCAPRWISKDSERWNITAYVTHWKHLPMPPNK